MEPATRQRLLWTLVFSVPPGVGMMGFMSVGRAGGAVTAEAVGAGLLTSLVIGGFMLLVTANVGPDTAATDAESAADAQPTDHDE